MLKCCHTYSCLQAKLSVLARLCARCLEVSQSFETDAEEVRTFSKGDHVMYQKRLEDGSFTNVEAQVLSVSGSAGHTQ
eukprot:scaffold75692_cov35-Prasinocladus_malaysianus.AAC.3